MRKLKRRGPWDRLSVRLYHRWARIRKLLRERTHCNPRTREPWWFVAQRRGYFK